MGEMRYNDRGEEIPDPTPIAMPVGFRRPPSIGDMVKKLVRQQLSDLAAAQGMESFEESDDLDVDDDPEIKTPYEITADHEVANNELRNKLAAKRRGDNPPVDDLPPPTKKGKKGKAVQPEEKKDESDGGDDEGAPGTGGSDPS